MTTEISAALQARLDTLLARHQAVERHLRNADGRLDADDPDRAAFSQNDEVLERLDDQALAEIDALRSALDRVAAGTYGVCVACGADIAPGRLQALPHIATCTTCASLGA